MNFGIAEVYCGDSGKMGYYNSQQIGLSRAMKKLGYRCFIFLPDARLRSVVEEVVEEGITVVKCPSKTIGVNAKFDWRIIKNYDVRVLQVNSDNHLFSTSLLSFCDDNNILAYSYFGTVQSDSNSLVKRLIMSFVFKCNSKIFKKHMNYAKTQQVKEDLKKAGIDGSQVAPVGLDTSVIPIVTKTKQQLREECDVPHNMPIILYVGRIEPYKRPNEMIDLMNRIKYSYGIMIGDGSLSDEIEKELEERHLTNRIKWIRALPNEEIHQYFKMADFYVNFNDHEIFGMSILEAMYQGCTVIAVHAPGPDMIIEDGISGYLVSNHEEIVDIIQRNGRLSEDVIKKRIVNSFIWDNTACGFDEWIKENMDHIIDNQVI